MDVSFSILTMENHINDLLELGLMSMWYPATERQCSCCQQVSCQGDWLTLEKFSHIVHSNMMSSRGGKLKEERE